MLDANIESRVEALESRVSELQDQLESLQPAQRKNWKRTIGAFTDNEGLQSVLNDAMSLREADRNSRPSSDDSGGDR